MDSLNRSLFWDVDPITIDEVAHAPFIIRRVLARGDMADVRFILGRYGTGTVADVARSSRDLDDRSRNFWTGFFENIYAPRNA